MERYAYDAHINLVTNTTRYVMKHGSNGEPQGITGPYLAHRFAGIGRVLVPREFNAWYVRVSLQKADAWCLCIHRRTHWSACATAITVRLHGASSLSSYREPGPWVCASQEHAHVHDNTGRARRAPMVRRRKLVTDLNALPWNWLGWSWGWVGVRSGFWATAVGTLSVNRRAGQRPEVDTN